MALLEFFWMVEVVGSTLRAAQPRLPLIVDSVDVHFRRLEAAVAFGHSTDRDAAQTRERELAAYRSADVVLAVTHEEGTVLKDLDVRRVHVLSTIEPQRPREFAWREPVVLFIGGFRHTPNVDAAVWLLSTIWPAVVSCLPTATLWIVGPEPPPEVRAHDGQSNVRVLGAVPTLDKVWSDAAVAVAPLRFGGGIKGKVVEAMAAGVPVVTTSVGMQGLPKDGGAALVADDSAGIAEALLCVLSDPKAFEPMATRARKVVEELCGESRARRVLEDVLKDAVAARPRRGHLIERWEVLSSGMKRQAGLRDTQ